MSETVALLVACALATATLGGVAYFRLADQARRDRDRLTFRLRFAAGLTSDAVLAFVRSLGGVLSGGDGLIGTDSVVLEVAASGVGIEHRVRLPRRRADAVLAQLRAAIPSVDVEETGGDARITAATELRLSSLGRPLRTDQPVSTTAALLAAMQPLGQDESLILQWVVRPTRRRVVPPTPAGRRSPSAGPFDLSALLRAQTVEAVSSRDWRDKTAEPLLGASLRIGASCPDRRRARALVRRVRSVLQVVARPGVSLLRRRLPAGVVTRAVEQARTAFAPTVIVNAAELAGLLGWPLAGVSVPGLRLQRRRLLAPSPQVGEAGRVLGTAPGSGRALALSAADSLHHAHLIGPTGVGKSTLLASLICQDVAAGRGVVVVDPKGDLVRAVLDRIPAERNSDVILLDPTDEHTPVGLNPLAGATAAPELVADHCLSLFHRLYAAFWGPRTADILHASLLTLAQSPGATLCELPLLLTNDSYRYRLVGRLNDPIALEPFWAWYEQLSMGERSAAIGPVMNKLRAFLLRRRLRACIGQATPTWTMDDVLNRRRILLVSLGRGELGAETATLVGSLVVASLWQAIQRRSIRLPAMVVLDEFQDIVGGPTDLGELLAQARGFGVSLSLAHQHLGQLDPRTRATVLANARTKVVFQTSADDASVLAKQLGGGLASTDLMNLPRHEAYLAACVGGEVLPPASLVTWPMTASLGSAQAVRVASRQRYGRPRDEVEAAIAARQGVGNRLDGEPLGRRRRAS